MRVDDALTKAQKAKTLEPAIKVTLTHDSSEHVYGTERILSINHPEEPYRQSAEVLLDNSDGALTSLDLKGFKAVISYGLNTKEGKKYSDTAPLWVIAQQLSSVPGKLTCELRMVGIPNMLAEDRADDTYIPPDTDTKTVKTLLTEIITASLACYSNCHPYEVVFDSEDSLINSYKPRDSFRIYVGGSRLAAIRRLLDYTKCVMRFGADGKIHILNPTTGGEVYDYEYSLEVGHTFFAKAYRKTLVIPNYIEVKSNPDDTPQYSGFAKDQESIDAFREVRQYERTRLDSDEADDIALAILSKYQLNAEMGAAEVPMNCGAELFDYVRVTDAREKDYRIGNLGSITRIYKPGQYSMRFSFGGWLTVRGLMSNLEVYPSGMGTVTPSSFERLYAKDAYIENLSIDQIIARWLDPESNIDLSKIGDNLDGLPDGEAYARVKALHIDAGKIKLDENILYKSGYNPSEKMPGDADLDNIPDGDIYQRVKSSALTAAGLVILDNVILGTYGLVKSTDISAGHIKLETCSGDIDDIGNGIIYGKVRKTDISAGHIKLVVDQDLDEQGIEIVSSSSSTRIRINDNRIAGYKTGVLQFELRASDGRAYCGGGNVVLDEDGVHIRGSIKAILFESSAGSLQAEIWRTTTGVLLIGADARVSIRNWLTPVISLGNSALLGEPNHIWRHCYLRNIRPGAHEQGSIGYSTEAFAQIVGEYIYSGDGAIHSYQEHDDIALLKAIKTKKKKGKDVIDAKTLPKELVIGNDYVNIAGLQGLSIGIMSSLLARIEALEARG